MPLRLFYCILFLFFFVENSSTAQNHFSKGYIILNDGSKVEGTLEYRGWHKDAKHVSFKKDTFALIEKFSPTQIKAFFLREQLFESAPVKLEKHSSTHNFDSIPQYISDTVFLEALIEGDKNLYLLKDEHGKDHFFISANGVFIHLVHRKYFKRNEHAHGKDHLVTDNSYKDQLASYLGDCASFLHHVNSVRYDKFSLVKAFRYYYKCKNENISYSENIGSRIEAGILAGPYFSSLSFSGSTNSFLENTDYSNSVSGMYGVFGNILLTPTKLKIILTNQLLYTSTKYSGEYLQFVNVNNYTSEKSSFSNHFLKLFNMARIQYPLDFHIAPYLNFGLSTTFSVKSSNQYKKSVVFFSDPKVNEGAAIKEEVVRKTSIGLVGGLGLNYRSLFLEFGMERNNSITKSKDPKGNVMSSYFLLGYKF